MTAQISDGFFYRGKEFALAGIKGEGLFEPAEHGLQPVSTCTACWRGYQCTYVVQDNHLLLDRLEINNGSEDDRHLKFKEPPPLNGRAAEISTEDRSWFKHSYSKLAMPIPFSGGLLLARGFIEDLYVHMGFHPAWKFKEVHELIFKDGSLSQGSDRSAEMAKLREGMKGKGECEDMQELTAWIERCFSLKYDW